MQKWTISDQVTTIPIITPTGEIASIILIIPTDTNQDIGSIDGCHELSFIESLFY